MEKHIKGDIVVINFPFSDLSTTKKRPALVMANLGGDDLLLCQISSTSHQNSIPLNENDFFSGTLRINSFIRVDKIFTIDKKLILYKAGRISIEKQKEVENKLIQIIQK